MPIEITPALLADLRKKAVKATKGPWEAVIESECDGSRYCSAIKAPAPKYFIATGNMEIEDGEYVAAAHPTVVLAMVAEIERLRAEVGK